MRTNLRNQLRSRLRARLRFVLAAVAVLALWQAAPAQPSAEPAALTLPQAVKIALEKNPLRKVEIGRAHV